MSKTDLISVHQFKYENANRHIRHAAVPSNPTWDEMKNYTWADLKKFGELRNLTWESVEHTSDKLNDIMALVGTKNLIDAKHFGFSQLLPGAASSSLATRKTFGQSEKPSSR